MEAINLDCIGIFYSLSPINTLAKAMSCLFFFLITYLHV